MNSLSTGEIGCELVVYLDYASDYKPISAFLTDLRGSFESNDIDIYLAPVTQVEMVESNSKKDLDRPEEGETKAGTSSVRRGKK